MCRGKTPLKFFSHLLPPIPGHSFSPSLPVCHFCLAQTTAATSTAISCPVSQCTGLVSQPKITLLLEPTPSLQVASSPGTFMVGPKRSPVIALSFPYAHEFEAAGSLQSQIEASPTRVSSSLGASPLAGTINFPSTDLRWHSFPCSLLCGIPRIVGVSFLLSPPFLAAFVQHIQIVGQLKAVSVLGLPSFCPSYCGAYQTLATITLYTWSCLLLIPGQNP